jgi:hypothetical protein
MDTPLCGENFHSDSRVYFDNIISPYATPQVIQAHSIVRHPFGGTPHRQGKGTFADSYATVFAIHFSTFLIYNASVLCVWRGTVVHVLKRFHEK